MPVKKNNRLNILTSILIALFLFQPHALATLTIGQEKKIGRYEGFHWYSNAWLGSNNTGYAFLGWVDEEPPGPSETIRFQTYLNHEPYGNEIRVHQEFFSGVTFYPRGCADNKGNVYLAWQRTNAGVTHSNFMFTRSSDFGQTWSAEPPQRLNSVEMGVAAYVYDEFATVLGCDGAGNVYAMWPEFHPKYPGLFNDVYFARSADFGQTWSKPILVNSSSARSRSPRASPWH